MTIEEKKLRVYDIDRQLELLQHQVNLITQRAQPLDVEKQKLLAEIEEETNKDEAK